MKQLQVGVFGGLGAMASPMARHWRNRDEIQVLRVHDRGQAGALREARREAWRGAGAELTPSVEAVCDGVDGVFVCMGKNGDDSALIQNLVGRLKPGSFLCHLSTVSPQFASRATALCGRHSVVYGNYPVTGGPVGAETGKLLILCSGSEELFQRLSAPLRYLGEPRFFGLRSDAAAEVKLIGHVMVFFGLLGISGAAALQSECFLGGTVGGGEQSEFLEFLNRGAGGTRQWEVALSKGLRDGVWDQGFFIEHALVDALYLAELLRERGVSSIIIHPIIDLALAFSFVLRTTTGGLATHSVVRELIKSRAAELDRFIDERRGGVAERIIHVVESLPPALRSTVQFDALASA